MSNGELDFTALQAEIDKMTPEQIKDALLGVRVRQKVSQKKYQSPERQKAYQAKVRERNRILKEKAVALGLYDDINAEAERVAEAKLAEELSGDDEG